jgi:hypothetical protein
MEKIKKEDIEKIMKEIEKTTEKFTRELMFTEKGKKFANQLDEKICENFGFTPKTDKDPSNNITHTDVCNRNSFDSTNIKNL